MKIIGLLEIIWNNSLLRDQRTISKGVLWQQEVERYLQKHINWVDSFTEKVDKLKERERIFELEEDKDEKRVPISLLLG